ncbi:MAG: GspE/PulE family protein [Aquabacterium sp.]
MALKSSALLSAAVEVGLIESDMLATLTLRSRRERVDLIDLVCLHGRLPPSALYQAVAECRSLPFIAAGYAEPDDDAMRRLSPSLLQRGSVACVRHQNEVWLWTADPDDHATHETARRLIGSPRAIALGEPESIASLVNRWTRKHQPSAMPPSTDGQPALDHIGGLNAIFKQAYLARASDIHFEPGKEGMRVRLRVDGRLRDYPRELTLEQGAGLVSRTKVLAGMDISETREPQDGGLRHEIPGVAAFDVRVATAPTRFGERATLRLMGEQAEALTLERLGMHAQTLSHFRETIARPHGIVLITGPTGSGKSTTLYAALGELTSPETNVLSVEDPIERVIEGVSQVQVNGKISFAGALRSFLRHDPDVIMLGEIRDLETADVALKAAVTGHLVFSTLHTNSAAAAVTRLADMGVERFMIGATLSAVIAQRLVRRLCQRCKTERPASPREKAMLGTDKVHVPHGCSACVGTGWRGRIGLFETLWIDGALAQRIAAGDNEAQIQAQAKRFESLWSDGLRKVLSGSTTLDEVLSVAHPPDELAAILLADRD